MTADLQYWNDSMQYWNDLMPSAAEHVARIPEHMRESVVAYVVNGRPIGGFMTALFSGDPVWIVLGRADDNNQRAIMDWARLIYSACPGGCFGSREHIDLWIEVGGLRGALREPK